MKQGREKVMAVIGLFGLLLVTVGVSFAAFTYIGQGQKTNIIQTGNLTFVYDEANKEGNGISISNATPTSDDLGMTSRNQNEVFEFSVTASTKGAPIYYEIYTAKQESSTLPEKIVKTYLTSVQGEEETGIPNTLTSEVINTYRSLGSSTVPDQENGRTLYQEMISEGQSSYAKTYRYRMWISNTATEVDENGVWKYNDMTFTVKVNVYASNEEIGMPEKPQFAPEYVDHSGANKPVLVEGMIPVVYDEDKLSWVKQDIESSYAYQDQMWANAVTVTETNRERYINAKAGTPISMDDINTMWVWIPRYEYMYTNLGDQYAGGTGAQPGEIKINFLEGVSNTVSDRTNYKVHPAFTFGNSELEGIWYAKFETGGTLPSACQNESCNVNNIVIKPSVISLRNQQVSSFFFMARSMQMNSSSPFGFSKTDSNLHMSKNDEWGAVAYLSQSVYGKYGNPNYSGIEKEVRINNCSSFITGIGANSQSEVESTVTCTTNDYDTVNGQAASTTGNTTGVYDMAGGTWEYVMGVLADPSGKPRSGQGVAEHSGFNGMLADGKMYTNGLAFPDSKYYNLYTSSSNLNTGSLSETACNSGICFGHALSETGTWYGDGYNFVSASFTWSVRGGGHKNDRGAGAFDSRSSYGCGYNTHGTRLVNVPIK